ncbi:MAG: FG-GAP repeat protein, partial [Planctomycetota bacterium]
MHRSPCLVAAFVAATVAPVWAFSNDDLHLPEGLSAADWAAVRADIDAHRYQVAPVDDGFAVRHPRQAWTARFDRRGLALEPDSGAWAFGLELAAYGADGAMARAEQPSDVRALGARVEYDWSSALTEWYVNDSRGVEHGYTVRTRPVAGDAPLRFELDVRGDLAPRVHANGRDVSFHGATEDGRGVSFDYSGLIAFDALGRDLPAHFALDGDDLVISVDDRGATYPLTIDPIAHQTYVKASNTTAEDFLGWSIALDGDTLVCGAWGESSIGTGIDNGSPDDESNGSSGAVYVYTRTKVANQDVWTQQAYIKTDNPEPLDSFGWSVDIDGDTLVVGAIFEDSNQTNVTPNGSADNSAADAGAAYVFVRNAGVWSQQAYLKANNAGAGDQFGFSVAVSGDVILVGANFEDSNADGIGGAQGNGALDAGAVYAFVRNAGVWTQEAYIKSSASDAGDQFGYSVSFDGDLALVGAPYEDSSATGVNGLRSDNAAPDAGATFVFTRNAGVWSQTAYLKASDAAAGDRFGCSVSLDGGRAVVGAPGRSTNTGAAYVFDLVAGAWGQSAILTASNGESGDEFGCAVAVSGPQILVGAYFEDSNATGIDGDGSDNSQIFSGAVYSYLLDNGTWGQSAYIKAPNTDIGDNFGHSVAILGETGAIGAPIEDSAAVGIDGDMTNKRAGGAGAAFVVSLPIPMEPPVVLPPNCARKPASVLVFPIHRSSLMDPTFFTVLNVTNTSRECETCLHYQYVNVAPPKFPFFFADCKIADRVECLTPADTLSVLTSCHNSATNAQGYVVVSARDPELIDTNWSFNHLIGSEYIISAAGGMYALLPQSICSPIDPKLPTDLDGDGKLDFDGKEYYGLADELYIDSYTGAFEGDLVLISFLGGEYLNAVDFVIYNDDEFQLSANYTFACWTRVPLGQISGYFTQLGLATTSTDPTELDLNCDGLEDLNTGWAIVRGKNALSITSDDIVDPVILGALANDNLQNWMNA